MNDFPVDADEVLDGSALVEQLGHFLHDYELARRAPRSLMMLYGRANMSLETDAEQPTDDVHVTVSLPFGARWSEQPPWLPQEGIYCFPSGNFRPLRDLGWPLAMTSSRKAPNTHVVGVERMKSLMCRHCRLSMSVVIGPFITTLVVHKPDQTARHTCEQLKRKR